MGIMAVEVLASSSLAHGVPHGVDLEVRSFTHGSLPSLPRVLAERRRIGGRSPSTRTRKASILSICSQPLAVAPGNI